MVSGLKMNLVKSEIFLMGEVSNIIDLLGFWVEKLALSLLLILAIP